MKKGEFTTTANFVGAICLSSCRVNLPTDYMLKCLQSQGVRRGEITTTVNFARVICLIVFM